MKQTYIPILLFAFLSIGLLLVHTTTYERKVSAAPLDTGTPTLTPTLTPTATNTLGPCQKSPKAPKLIAPSTGARVNQQKVLLDWNSVKCNPQYSVVVHKSSKTGLIVDSKTRSKTQYTTKSLPRGFKYFWNVTACTTGGCTTSGWHNFFINRPTPTPTRPPKPTNTPPAGGGGNCSPAYPTVCIPPPPPDLDCGDIPYRNFQVLPPDPHRFDGDHDGIGCET